MYANDLGDPLQYRECGRFRRSLNKVGEAVVSIVCEKCMPFGTFVTIQNGNDAQLGFVEIGLFGLKNWQ